MRPQLVRRRWAPLAGTFTTAMLYACAPQVPDATSSGYAGNAGQTGLAGYVGVGAGYGTQGSGGATGLSGFGTSLGGTATRPVTLNGPDGSCTAISQAPEQIVVYKDASVTDVVTDVVTDTITTTSVTATPVAVFIMQDRSGSMITGFPPPASAMSWDNSTAAITAFVNDPASAGIDIGLGTFPAGAANTADCSAGSDCGNPVVPIAPLPGNASAMIQAMQKQRPTSGFALTPTECGLRGMVNECLTYQATHGETCVGILVTDGTPTQCDTNENDLVRVIADGKAKGVATYTLGLPGADLSVLNQYAVAGGTTAAIDVSAGADAFINALQSIRKQVVVTESHTTTSHVSHPVTTVVSTPMVISKALDCQWKIPPPPAGQTLDPSKVNLQMTNAAGVATRYGHVASVADCARAVDGWYYDNPSNPTQVLVCPNTCETLKAAVGARVDLLFGCATVQTIIR